MLSFECLTEENLVIYAMKNYNNPCCLGINEFYDDLKRAKYLKRLFSRFVAEEDLKDRLILNHLIIFYNVFETEAATKILFHKIPKQFWSQLKTFLIYLNYMPEIITGVLPTPIISSDIQIDLGIVSELRKI